MRKRARRPQPTKAPVHQLLQRMGKDAPAMYVAHFVHSLNEIHMRLDVEWHGK